MSELILRDELRWKIEEAGAAAYPNECCGILLGRDKEGRRVVEELEAAGNVFEAQEQFHRFLVDPGQLLAAEKRAGKDGRLILGFYHSHPDHPARPSEYDRQHAWPFYSYVIVAIDRGRPGEMTCWRLDESTGAFLQQEIIQETTDKISARHRQREELRWESDGMGQPGRCPDRDPRRRGGAAGGEMPMT